MNLLDSLTMGSRGGYGGLLDMLLYRQQAAPQPQMDTMAGFVTPEPQSPFGPTPQLGPLPKYEPVLPPSVFNQGAAPVAGMMSGAPSAPPLPPAQSVSPAPQPAPMADPSPSMNIGGYQMPQIGTMADYTPVGGATDFSAQSRQPQQMQPAQGQLPPALGGGAPQNGFLRGLQSVANGGGIISAMSGNYNDPRSVQQSNLKAQYDTLVPMLGPQKAMLAVMNPEAGKLLIEQAVGSKQKFTEIGVDGAGAKQYGFVNDRDQTVKPRERNCAHQR